MGYTRIFQFILISFSSIQFIDHVILADDFPSFILSYDVTGAIQCSLDSPNVTRFVKSKLQCALFCEQQGSCLRFNYRSDTRQCQVFASQTGLNFSSNDRNCKHYKVGYMSFSVLTTYNINQKTYRLKKRDLSTRWHKRRQIKLLNLWSMHLYKCQSHNL